MSILKIKHGKNLLRIKDCKGFASATGLMFNSLEKTDGALIYANNIWMPFCKKPLDLFFLDENFKILSVERAVPLNLFNTKTWKIYTNEKAKYCLEILAGKAKFKKRQKIKFL